MKSKLNAVLIIVFTLVMVFSCVWISNAADSTGSTDISSEAVDSITVKDKYGVDRGGTVENWENCTVVVTFSEDDSEGNQKSGLDIQGGDTITIKWTAPPGITFAGKTETFYLYAENGDTQVAIATVTVTNDECTILFNDNVNSLQHVSCTMYFYIYVSGDIDASDATGTVFSGDDISTNVNVVEAESSTSSSFFHKSAIYSTDGSNTITWSIWLNEDHRQDLSGNIIIEDTLPSTETFKSFVYYTSEDLNGKWEAIARTLEMFNTGDRKFEIIDDNGKTKIKITVPVNDTNTTNLEDSKPNLNTPVTGLVVFKTKSTAATGETVTNTAKVTYTSGSETTTIEDSESIASPISNGTVTGTPLGSITINKLVEGTDNPVEGVTFRAYKVKSESDHTRISGWNGGADYKEVTTDEDGTASVTDLTDGVYELVEMTDDLPDWIAKPKTTSRYVTVEGTDETVNIENSVKTGDISATKKWTQNDGTTADTSDHPTVYFKLYRSVDGGDAEAVEDAEIKTVETASGESSAEVTWNDLPLYDDSGNKYTYSVKEVDADGNDYTPSGYSKTENGLTVTNASKITYSDVTAKKKWTQNDGTTADTSDHPTVYFKLYRSVNGDDAVTVEDADIKAVETASGESSAKVTWQDMPAVNSAGEEYTYSVKEVDSSGNDYTPSGYSKNEDGLTVTNVKDITNSDVTAALNWVENDGTTADTSDHETVYFKLYRSVDGNTAAAGDTSAQYVKTASAGSSSVLAASVSSVDAEAVESAEIKEVVTASGDSTAEVTWSDLPETNSAGQEYTYYVQEVDADGNDYTPSGYTKTEDGLTVMNVKDITYSDVTAVEKWVEHDGTTADTSSHPTVYFKLYRSVSGGDAEAVSGAEIKKIKTASGKSSTSVKWTDLPETNSAGQEYTYSVKEVDADGNDYTPEGYTKSEDGLIVINKLKKTSSSKNTTDKSNTIDSGKSGNNTVKTGDTSNIALWVSLLIISAAVIAVICYRKRRDGR